MKQWIKWSMPAVALALATASVNATPVVGAITFAGGVTLNSSSANTATTVTGWQNPYVESDSGNFATYIPSLNMNSVITPVAIVQPWNFNTPMPGINNFWTVTANGETFTFNLTQSSILNQGGGSVTVSGNGMISGSGVQTFTASSGTWTFTTQDPSASGVFSFSAAVGTVPDSGTTVMLLGSALTGLGLLKRKLMA